MEIQKKTKKQKQIAKAILRKKNGTRGIEKVRLNFKLLLKDWSMKS